MVTLPTQDDLPGSNVPQVSSAVAQINRSDATATARALGEAGDALQQSGDLIADREFTAMAKERDTFVSDTIRQILYDPETGFANKRGREAVSARKTILEQLETLKAAAGQDLPRGAMRKLEGSLQSRIDSALNTVDRHTSAQRTDWINGASAARIESAFQDSIANPQLLDQALSTITSELRGQQARNGWSEEEFRVELDKARSGVIHNRVVQIASQSPEEALEMLDARQASMRPSDYQKLRNTIEPMAFEAEGKRIGRLAAAGVPVLSPQHGAVIDFELTGKARPNPPAKNLQNLLGHAATAVLGEGARIVIFSGKENEGHQHGSNRHRTGLAADIRVYDPSGQLLKLSDPRAREFMKMAARLGARGIGAGAEYMGDAFHIDMVPHDNYHARQGPVWASLAASMGQELINEMNAGGQFTLPQILNIENPDVRAAALKEYELITGVVAQQAEGAIKQASQAAFEFIDQGGSVDQLSADVRAALGRKEMSSLIDYENKVKTGIRIETDPATYLYLRQLQAEDPTGFQRINLLEYRSVLDEGDFQKFADAQTGATKRENGFAPSTLMSTAKRSLDAAGFDRADEQQAFQAQIVQWQDNFISENNRAPTYSEIQSRVDNMMVDVVIDPAGRGNRQGANTLFGGSLSAFQIDYDGDPLDASDDIGVDDLMDGALQINGETVSDDRVRSVIMFLSEELGEEPTAQEVVEMLVASGFFE